MGCCCCARVGYHAGKCAGAPLSAGTVTSMSGVRSIHSDSEMTSLFVRVVFPRLRRNHRVRFATRLLPRRPLSTIISIVSPSTTRGSSAHRRGTLRAAFSSANDSVGAQQSSMHLRRRERGNGNVWSRIGLKWSGREFEPWMSRRSELVQISFVPARVSNRAVMGHVHQTVAHH